MAVDCGTSCPASGGFYGYRPNVASNVVLLVPLCLLVPCIWFLRLGSRTSAFSTTLMVGVVLEVLGFVGRILLHGSGDSRGYFALSLLGTVLGPAFVSAALFVLFPLAVKVCGGRVSRRELKLARLVLCTVIAAAVGIDVIGVVFISYGFNGVTRDHSASIIEAGLCMQVVSLLFSAAVYLAFSLGPRSDDGGVGDGDDGDNSNDRNDNSNNRNDNSDSNSNSSSNSNGHAALFRATKSRRFLRGAEAATILILVHSIYRIVEIAGGLDGTLFQNEAAFMVMNGALPLLSVLLLTIFHPEITLASSPLPPSLSRRTRRPTPLSLGENHRSSHSHAQGAHYYAYDPNLGTQLSPQAQSPRSPRTMLSSNTICVASASASTNANVAASPGLPACPGPMNKPSSPGGSSTMPVVYMSNRYSVKSDRRLTQPKELVDSDALW
ncbi:hypothetical protein E4U21_004799 [Claviceps maximensis]|nr:hypothetical protein E4U21_004799 [Claviceps maximensis]